MKRVNKKVFDEFCINFPLFSDNIVKWEQVNEFEYAIEYEDGFVLLYDSFEHTIKKVDPDSPNTFIDIDERKWRMEFARRLYRLMRKNDFTQIELSYATGISASAISYYLNGVKLPNIFNAAKIADVLDCSLDDLVTFDWRFL